MDSAELFISIVVLALSVLPLSLPALGFLAASYFLALGHPDPEHLRRGARCCWLLLFGPASVLVLLATTAGHAAPPFDSWTWVPMFPWAVLLGNFIAGAILVVMARGARAVALAIVAGSALLSLAFAGVGVAVLTAD